MTEYIFTYEDLDYDTKEKHNSGTHNFVIDTGKDNLEETIEKISNLLKNPNMMPISIKSGNYCMAEEGREGLKKMKSVLQNVWKYIPELRFKE